MARYMASSGVPIAVSQALRKAREVLGIGCFIISFAKSQLSLMNQIGSTTISMGG
jgi:hypothetical protein